MKCQQQTRSAHVSECESAHIYQSDVQPCMRDHKEPLTACIIHVPIRSCRVSERRAVIGPEREESEHPTNTERPITNHTATEQPKQSNQAFMKCQQQTRSAHASARVRIYICMYRSDVVQPCMRPHKEPLTFACIIHVPMIRSCRVSE